MKTKKPPSFEIVSANGTKAFRFDHRKMPVPRVGDHVVIYGDSESAETALEGEVTQVIWVIGNDTKDFGTYVVVEEGSVPNDFT
jgi:hypothetical protein